MIIKAQAYARAGLLGNPSDQHYGKTISISIKNFAATISLYETPELCIVPEASDSNTFSSIHELVESITQNGYYGGTRLIKATIKRFYQYLKTESIKFHNKNFSIRYHSTIPRQVGLSGSSAIVTATMRALMNFYQVKIPLPILPTLALSVENEELGMKAGLQDRVIQAYEGCVYMDFKKEIMDKKGHGVYERLDVSCLPAMYIAYNTELSKVSSTVFDNVHKKFQKGDQYTINILNQIAELALKGYEAIRKKDYATLSKLINKNFDLRRQIYNINPIDLKMVEIARKCGASAKFAGSGGAIIGTFESEDILTKLIVELKKVKARVLKPYII